MWTIIWTRLALINRCSGTLRHGIGTRRRTTSSGWTSCQACRCSSCYPWPWPRSYSSEVCSTTERKYKWGPAHDEKFQLDCTDLESCFMWCGHVWLIQINSEEDVLFFYCYNNLKVTLPAVTLPLVRYELLKWILNKIFLGHFYLYFFFAWNSAFSNWFIYTPLFFFYRNLQCFLPPYINYW